MHDEKKPRARREKLVNHTPKNVPGLAFQDGKNVDTISRRYKYLTRT